MSGENWTPGPWTPFGVGDEKYPGIDSWEHGVSVVIFGEDSDDDEAGIRGRNEEEAKANAYLISAASELYEALKHAKCPDCNGDGVVQNGDDIEPCGWCEQRRQALAKARGEQT